MIIKSKKMVYDGKQYTEPEWTLDTAQRTVTHVDPKTMETTVTDFHTDYVKDHLRYVTAKHPERLEKLLDEGRIISYLDELESRAVEAVDRQVEIWKKSNKEYLSAVLSGDEMKQVRLTNGLESMARELVYDSIIYA